jgi:hypothetical protein
MQKPAQTYRKAAKQAREFLINDLLSQGVKVPHGYLNTTKIVIKCKCGKTTEAAKVTVMYNDPQTGRLTLALQTVTVCPNHKE